jgi:hypothetical protein
MPSAPSPSLRLPRAPRSVLSAAPLLALALACSSENGPEAPASPDAGLGATDAAQPVRPRPAGPAADVSEPLTGGNGPFIGAATGLAVPSGYVEHEAVAAGTATAYAPSGALTEDGRWTFEPSSTAAYRTRILVRRPAEAASASGTVLVEWLNVSGGVDANPDYASLHEEITRQGHVWVGVSAQLIGVEGGPVLVSAPGAEDLVGRGLKALDPERYGSLVHPGDGYAFDIFTQVARAVLAGGALLGGARAEWVLAVGESQSAIALTTYYNGVQPLTLAFDGFLVHSRGSAALPLVGPGEYADLAGAIANATPALLRDDLEAPVLELQAESDVVGVLNSASVRQPDTDRFRLWEVAGTAHADAHLLGDLAGSIDCGVPINDGPMHLVAKAALRGLEAWTRTGKAPSTAPLLELTTGTPRAIVRDADGIALGGLRTPPVDVPVDVLSGEAGSSPTLLCLLLGSTTPLPDARLAELYPSRAAYEAAYETETDGAIAAGFVLEDDRAALLGYADPSRVAP